MDGFLTAFAPAKVNLCLHITGRRADGYHLLDSLAAFADIGDTLTAKPAEALSLTIAGPFGGGLLANGDNLVLRAARALAARCNHPAGARLHLDKHLPVASGIGGGSADAAAALRLLSVLWRIPPAVQAALPGIAAELGADVPVCLSSTPTRMRGAGERLDATPLPRLGLMLVNCGQPVATRAVFAAWAQTGGNRFSPPLTPGVWTTAAALAGWLATTSNDLQAPALQLCPEIGTVLDAIARTPGCLLSRMSGSGATCFGLYADPQSAVSAAALVARPGWWLWAGPAISAVEVSRPQQGPGAAPLA